jgi:ABC-type proline/glycine betaine transport system ATPase subunit
MFNQTMLDLGKKRQIGTPVELLKTPADDYVRRSVGDNLARRRKNLERFL